MSQFAFDVTVDDNAVRRLFDRAPAAITQALRRLVEGGAIDVQRYMRMQAPVAVTGQLRGSIRYTMHLGDTISAEVAPAADYAPDVEYGTKPHVVSVAEGSSLAKWAELKGANPHAVAAGIALHGTRAHPFVQPTYEAMQDPVQITISNGIASLIRDFDNGVLPG